MKRKDKPDILIARGQKILRCSCFGADQALAAPCVALLPAPSIHSRIVHFNGSIQYEVSYVVQSKTVRIWEPAAAVPKTAVDRWLARRIAFRYTPEETELMKKCGGS